MFVTENRTCVHTLTFSLKKNELERVLNLPFYQRGLRLFQEETAEPGGGQTLLCRRNPKLSSFHCCNFISLFLVVFPILFVEDQGKFQ